MQNGEDWTTGIVQEKSSRLYYNCKNRGDCDELLLISISSSGDSFRHSHATSQQRDCGWRTIFKMDAK